MPETDGEPWKGGSHSIKKTTISAVVHNTFTFKGFDRLLLKLPLIISLVYFLLGSCKHISLSDSFI